jgi:hypothetical protein
VLHCYSFQFFLDVWQRRSSFTFAACIHRFTALVVLRVTVRRALDIAATHSTSLHLRSKKQSQKPSSVTRCTYVVCSRVANFFLVHNTKTEKNIPNYQELYQMSIKGNKRLLNGPSVHKICQHLPLQDPPIEPKFGFLGWKQTIWQPCVGEVET